MSTYILVLFFHVGILGDTDSNAVTNIPGFHTEEACIAAGEKSKRLTAGTKKETRFVCLEQPNKSIY